MFQDYLKELIDIQHTKYSRFFEIASLISKASNFYWNLYI